MKYKIFDGGTGVVYFVKHQIYNRFIQHIIHANLLTCLNPERQISKRYEQTLPIIEKDEFYKVGNYYLSNKYPLSSNSIVYSIGILNDIKFDQAVSDKYGCNIFMFDPSIIATKYIEEINNPKFIFREVGVWIEKTTMRFSSPLYGGSPSMFLKHQGKVFESPCEQLSSLMNSNNHIHIDVLKMNIEGAAPPILNDMLDNEIYPNQIIAEFERPNSACVEEFLDFYQILRKLISRLKSAGYKMRVIRREKFRYYSLELIFVKE